MSLLASGDIPVVSWCKYFFEFKTILLRNHNHEFQQ